VENMKGFSNYQYVEGELMTERDKQEAGSKFWNKGKWDNFVAPFLPEDCKEMILVDMGCNAGLFLKLAEDKGFSKVIGIEANKEAIRRAIAYRERNKGTYELQRRLMQRSIDYLPIADYTILANSHYYFPIEQWLEYLDKLQLKTRYCIIITAHSEHRALFKASPLVADIRNYFKNWDETGIIDNVPMENDPLPRRLWGLCFKSRLIERAPINEIENANKAQKDFYKELDQGKPLFETNYYKYWKERRAKEYEERVKKGMLIKAALYNDIKKRCLFKPVIVNREGKVLEGNHRHEIMRHLGYKTIIIRRT
jgi:hypothetical protein